VFLLCTLLLNKICRIIQPNCAGAEEKFTIPSDCLSPLRNPNSEFGRGYLARVSPIAGLPVVTVRLHTHYNATLFSNVLIDQIIVCLHYFIDIR
jgi:hypothetical protein